MKNQWENPGVRGRGQYIVGVKALPNGHAFVGSDIFPQLPSLYGILQNKGYFLCIGYILPIIGRNMSVGGCRIREHVHFVICIFGSV